MIDPVVVSVRRTGPLEVALVLELDADHPAFAGHFPGRPILPGVVQIDWAITLAARYLDTAQPVGTDFQVKFRRTIGPDLALELRLWLAPAKGTLSFEYRSGGDIASSGRVRLEPG
jgi:3-hydroxymyristoyl/3-hydroxydecanoyl-(acyl carrier protein) dehydratase